MGDNEWIDIIILNVYLKINKRGWVMELLKCLNNM